MSWKGTEKDNKERDESSTAEVQIKQIVVMTAKKTIRLNILKQRLKKEIVN